MQEETIVPQPEPTAASVPEAETSIFQDMELNLQPYEKTMKNGRTWLYVIAAFQFCMGIFEYFQNEGLVGTFAFAIDAGVAVTFLIMALWSRKQPVPAFTTALVLYILFVIAFSVLDTSNIIRGIILKIIVVGALIKAVKDAKTYVRIRDSFGA